MNTSASRVVKFEKLELVFKLCERLGVAAATSVGGAAMLRFNESAFPPLPAVALVFGTLVLIGGICLAFMAAGMFFTEICGPNISRIGAILFAALIVIVTVCFVLAVVNAGVAALGS